jgi:hypothetical protein
MITVLTTERRQARHPALASCTPTEGGLSGTA